MADPGGAERDLLRTCDAILRWLPADEPMARGQLRRKVKAELRGHFDSAIRELIRFGVVEQTTCKRGRLYRRYTLTGRQPTAEGVPGWPDLAAAERRRWAAP